MCDPAERLDASRTGSCSAGSRRTLRNLAAYISFAAVLLTVLPTRAEDLSPRIKLVVGTTAADPAAVATKNVLALNTAMFDLYSASAQIFKANILARHPVILALFTGAGGRFILYRPGEAPLDAPPVPGALARDIA